MLNLYKTLLLLCVITPTLVVGQMTDSYQNIIYYPYHAAPYFSYPHTTGYGYRYSPPSVNANYSHPYNTRQLVVYPGGAYHYHNYYQHYQNTCFIKGNMVFCY